HQPGDRRVEREAAALARLGPPVTPALLGRARADQGVPCLIMERLPGPSLAEICARPEARAPAEVARVVAAVARALDAAHAAGVVHRDLKPAHVFLRHPGQARAAQAALIDFGLARVGEAGAGPGAAQAVAPGITRADERLGTPAYMAPEQCT